MLPAPPDDDCMHCKLAPGACPMQGTPKDEQKLKYPTGVDFYDNEENMPRLIGTKEKRLTSFWSTFDIRPERPLPYDVPKFHLYFTAAGKPLPGNSGRIATPADCNLIAPGQIVQDQTFHTTRWFFENMTVPEWALKDTLVTWLVGDRPQRTVPLSLLLRNDQRLDSLVPVRQNCDIYLDFSVPWPTLTGCQRLVGRIHVEGYQVREVC